MGARATDPRMKGTAHLISGRESEAFARGWLEQQGLRHICCNFRSRRGELDLVMLDQGCLVIIEVRYRKTASFGGPLWSVTPAKRRSLGRAAQSLLRAMPHLAGLPLRFDVIALVGDLANPRIDWRKQAFNFDGN
jgi:putative endonuclease